MKFNHCNLVRLVICLEEIIFYIYYKSTLLYFFSETNNNNTTNNNRTTSASAIPVGGSGWTRSCHLSYPGVFILLLSSWLLCMAMWTTSECAVFKCLWQLQVTLLCTLFVAMLCKNIPMLCWRSLLCRRYISFI